MLSEALRPASLDEVVGQDAVVAALSASPAGATILVGPPGSGKTTLMRLLAGEEYVALNAASSGVAQLRAAIASGSTLVIDEVHRFSKSQQDVLLEAVEAGQVRLIAATTENPIFALTPALRSRATVYTLQPLPPEAVNALIDKAEAHLGVEVDVPAREVVVNLSGGDARRALIAVQNAYAAHTATGRPGCVIDVDDLRAAWAGASGGKDDEYDLLSAYIKSVRGSDPDAALYYLARLLRAGVKPEAVARRLVISASEDVGLADNSALATATSAAHAVSYVGMPEAGICLAHATVALATAGKDNRAYQGLMNAYEYVDAHPHTPVPDHLKDPHSTHIRAHVKYQNPHHGATDQVYLPDGVPSFLPRAR